MTRSVFPAHRAESWWCEPLETRVVLAGTPFPTLAMLEDPANAVVRMETRYGVVDIELFGGDAPIAAGAFADLIDEGGYGATFFHRLVAAEALAGGLFRFSDEAGLSLRESMFGVDAAFARPNVERTLAVRVETGASETTGEWAFNLADNSGFTEWLVIGRVVQGWEVVQQIAGLPVEDLSGFFTTAPGTTLTQVPVTDNDPPPTGVTEDLLVSLTDIQVIKAQNSSDFYSHVLYYPEGFSWERVFEAVELMNTGGGAADYKVLVRYEWGARDRTLATGTLEPDRRETIIVSPGEVPSTMVRSHTPYAFEVWSTAPLVAGIRHMDFRAGVGESFFNPASVPDPSFMHAWSFNQVALGFGGSEAFILWQNTTGQSAVVTLTLYFEDSDPVEYTFDLDAHRRGGVRVRDLDLPAGAEFAGAVVRADTEIVSSITRYDKHRGGGDDEEEDRAGGIAALGTPGGGAGEGVAPWTSRGGDDPISILNATTQTATITFYLAQEEEDDDDGDGGGSVVIVERQVTVEPGRLLILGERDFFGDDDDGGSGGSGHRAFSVRYASDTPVTVSFLTSAFRGTGTAFGYFAAEETHFADGRVFTAPRGAPFGRQGIAVYNPNDTAVTLHFVFRFSDHEPVVTQSITLGAGETLLKRMKSFAPLLAQALGGLGSLMHNAYSVSVIADGAVVAQTLQRSGDARTELGMTLSPWVPLGAIR